MFTSRLRTAAMQTLGFLLLFVVTYCHPAFGQYTFGYKLNQSTGLVSYQTSGGGGAISIDSGSPIYAQGNYALPTFGEPYSEQYSLSSSLTAYGGYSGANLTTLNSILVSATITGPSNPPGVSSYGVTVTFGIRGIGFASLSGTNMDSVSSLAFPSTSTGQAEETAALLNGGMQQRNNGTTTISQMITSMGPTLPGGGTSYTITFAIPSDTMMMWTKAPGGEAYGQLQANIAVKVWVMYITGLGSQTSFSEPAWVIATP